MQQFWIFGYGSLMWRPGFAYVRSMPAAIRGYHRRLCVYSHVHRGTPENPGLVLGLDRGGTCHGLAFEIAPENWDDTIAYLRAREQVTSVYLERQVKAKLLESTESVDAVTYVVDRNHLQYAGVLSEDSILAHVVSGEGVSGACKDYVTNTVEHLRAMNIRDATLEAIARKLQLQAAISSS
jgi:cation transport protein ChaC